MRRAFLSLLLSLHVLCVGATTHVNDSGTWRQLNSIYVNDSGTWRQIQQAYINDSGTWRLVYSAFSVTKSGDASGSCGRLGPGNCSATTNSVQCIATGAVGSVTYSWAHISGDTASANSPSSAFTTFTRNANTGASLSNYSGVMRCTATDTGTGLVGTVDVTVNTTHINTA